MKFKLFAVSALALLAACNDDEKSAKAPPSTTSTFETPAAISTSETPAAPVAETSAQGTQGVSTAVVAVPPEATETAAFETPAARVVAETSARGTQGLSTAVPAVVAVPPEATETAAFETPASRVMAETSARGTQGVSTAVPAVVTVPSEETETAAFERLAPADKVFEDPNTYQTSFLGQIGLADVTEEASVKRHVININGQDVPFVARAGHLIAYEVDQTGESATTLPDGTVEPGKVPQAAIFYTAYTRDGLDKGKRPVTFIWNGGPGSSSIWLHLGSWGPKRLKSDAPNMPDRTIMPESFPFVDNDVSLLEVSDIVFVDPPGTGFSTAIAPLENRDLWGTDIDASVVANFITSYINTYNRQSSPKYLYGESYGGIRTPIVANLLEQAGTSGYATDPSGKPAQVLNGFILNSPLVDYNSNCSMAKNPVMAALAGSYIKYRSCAGYFPSYAMTADALKKSTKRGNKSQEQYLDELRQFARKANDEYENMIDTSLRSPALTDEGTSYLTTLSSYIGIPLEPTVDNLTYVPEDFRENLIPGFILGRYDARMMVPKGNYFDADAYLDEAFASQLLTYFPDFTNYKTETRYEPLNIFSIVFWKWARADAGKGFPQSVTDIQSVLTANPNAKMLVLHGYEDIATPGFQTELDLERANLKERIPVKWFEGGHMTYNTEASRAPLKETINKFYTTPAEEYVNGADSSTSAAVATAVQAMR